MTQLTLEQIDAQIESLQQQRERFIKRSEAAAAHGRAVVEMANDKVVNVVSKTRTQRGMTYGGEDSGMKARIGKRDGVAFIHLTGTYCKKDVDITFKVGDTVEYDSFNLRYLGVIEKITEKRITVNPRYGAATKSMDLYSFAWRNYNFDLEAANAENAETSHYI